MDKRILVAYASEFGSTREVAETIAEALRDAATAVDVQLVVDVPDVSSYDAVIVGSAIYNGRWLPEAIHFVQSHQPRLSTIPVAYFALSMLIRDDTPQNRRTVMSYLEPVRQAAPAVRPVSVGLFAGRMRYRNLPLLTRLVFWVKARLPSGDYRNWQAIRSWAEQVRPALLQAERGRAPEQWER